MPLLVMFIGTRAEFGHLKPLIETVLKQNFYRLRVYYLDSKYLNYEFKKLQIQYYSLQVVNLKPAFSFLKSRKIESMEPLKVFSFIVKKLTSKFRNFSDIKIILLGDRIETLAAGLVAKFFKMKLYHLHGGEKSLGSLDDFYRNILTLISNYHFPVTNQYKQNILSKGIERRYIFQFGALAVEEVTKIRRLKLSQIDIKIKKPYLLITFHPVTAEVNSGFDQLIELLGALSYLVHDYFLVFTNSNTDNQGDIFNKEILRFCRVFPDKTCFHNNLGPERYLSLIENCYMVVGNSSSGIFEAPIMGKPSLNIGSRQTGRYMPMSVKSVRADKNLIVKNIKQHRQKNLIKTKDFGRGLTSILIHDILREDF